MFVRARAPARYYSDFGACSYRVMLGFLIRGNSTAHPFFESSELKYSILPESARRSPVSFDFV